MFHAILTGCFILVAFVLAILAIVLPAANIHFVILISRFFEVMIPVLAVGALLKYLCMCPKSNK